MNLFDLIFIILFILCVVQSWIRCETFNFFFVLCFAGGLWVAETFTPQLQRHLEPLTQNQREAAVYTFFVILSWFAGRWMGRFFGPMVEKLKSRWSISLQIWLSGLAMGWMFSVIVAVETQLIFYSYMGELESSAFFPYLKEFRSYLHGLNFA